MCDIDAETLDTLAADIKGRKTGVSDVSKRHDVERMMKMLPIDNDMQQAS